MGFKLTCLKCGKEIIIEAGDVNASNLNEIEVYPVQGRAIIQCSCGNDSDIDYR